MKKLFGLVLLVPLLTGCEHFQEMFGKPTASARDPREVYCKAVGLIRWDEGTPDGTLRQIKIHNGVRRKNCPEDKYPVWYYDEVGAAPPEGEAVVVTPR